MDAGSTKIEIFQSVLLRNATVWPFSREVKQKQEPSFDILWLAARSWSYSYSRSSRTEFTGIEDDTWFCITERYFEMFNNLLSLQGRHSQGFEFKGQDPIIDFQSKKWVWQERCRHTATKVLFWSFLHLHFLDVCLKIIEIDWSSGLQSGLLGMTCWTTLTASCTASVTDVEFRICHDHQNPLETDFKSHCFFPKAAAQKPSRFSALRTSPMPSRTKTFPMMMPVSVTWISGSQLTNSSLP